jgi:hypothetical protein
MNSHNQPVLGYPSKKAAILAQARAGELPAVIAGKIGSTDAAVRTAIKHMRVAGQLPPGRRRAGEATASQSAPVVPPVPVPADAGVIGKAERLILATHGYIAEALGLSLPELAAVAVRLLLVPAADALPAAIEARNIPRGESGTAREAPDGGIGDLKQGTESAPRTPSEQARNDGPLDEPTRDDDEAELAALEAAAGEDVPADEPEPPQPEPEAETGGGLPAVAAALPPVLDGPSRFRLTDGGGQYLRLDGLGLTRDLGKAWKGTAPQYETVYKRTPQWRGLDPVPAP